MVNNKTSHSYKKIQDKDELQLFLSEPDNIWISTVP